MRRAAGFSLALVLAACGAPGDGVVLPVSPPLAPGAEPLLVTALPPAEHAHATPSPVVYATGVSSLSGGEALALRPLGELVVKSLQDGFGAPVELVAVDSGFVSNLGTFSVRNSDLSGIAIDPETGGVIVADQTGQRIALVSGGAVSTLFPLPWAMNPAQNGTGQQQYAVDPANPNLLYFWDSTRAAVFRLDRSRGILTEILALDPSTPAGQHLSTFTNDIALDPRTGTLLVADGASASVLEVDPSTSPATVTILFSGLPEVPHSLAVNPETCQVFVAMGFQAIYAGSRRGGVLTQLAGGFSFLTDIVARPAEHGTTVFAVDKSRNTVYRIQAPLGHRWHRACD